MADCVNCKCEKRTPSSTNISQLRLDNEEKLRDFAIMYRDLQTCNLADEGAKGFYNIWCMFENILDQLEWLQKNRGGN